MAYSMFRNQWGDILGCEQDDFQRVKKYADKTKKNYSAGTGCNVAREKSTRVGQALSSEANY